MPIHRHKGSSETCICIRGHFEEYFYDEQGKETESVLLDANGDVRCINVEKARWHSLECLESGSVLLECKDGKYEPLQDCDVLQM